MAPEVGRWVPPRVIQIDDRGGIASGIQKYGRSVVEMVKEVNQTKKEKKQRST